ncbi:hypothetical protein OF83DRAFT_1171113 [Amylostereum chailletii]|nr:hypothetical protein OF83DRAFT_1171113 [Amylostereum chailletii]
MSTSDASVRLYPPHKRPRTTEKSQDDAPIITNKSSELWMEDGSIVLRALYPCKRSAKVYRVHKSSLALHCSFFRDLFEGPQDEFVAASDKYEDLPVLDMHDTLQDVDDFLRAIYEPDFMLRHRNLHDHGLSMSDFPNMYGGILRLSRKYDAPRIRAVVVQAIEDQWPTTLAAWDAREAAIRAQLDDRAPQYKTNHYPDPGTPSFLCFTF